MSHPTQIDCERALELLATFLDDELDAPRMVQMEQHLQMCRSCFSRAEFERRLKARLREELRVRVLPQGFEDRMRDLLRRLPGEP